MQNNALSGKSIRPWRNRVLLAALLLAAGCNGEPGPTDPAARTPIAPEVPSVAGHLRVHGVVGALHQRIYVSRLGAGPVTDAVVTVNGVAIPHINQGFYSGALHEAAPDRSPLKVEVKVGGATVEATGTVFEAPVITSPAEGSAFSATDMVEVTWVRTADPARFDVCINCWENSLDGAVYSLPGTARQTTIPARDLADYGTGTIIVISAGERGSLSITGPVTSDSYIESSSSSTLRILRP